MAFFNFFKKIFKQKKKAKKTLRKKSFKKSLRRRTRKPRKKIRRKPARKIHKKKTRKKISKTPKRKTRKTVRRSKKRKIAKKKKHSSSVLKEKEIGVITHYFDKISVGIIKLKNPLAISEHIRIKGKNGEFTQVINSMQYNHKDILLAERGLEIGIKVNQPVHENDLVYKVI